MSFHPADPRTGPILDAHVHLGLERFVTGPVSAQAASRPAFRDRMERTIDQQIRSMDEHGVSQAIAFPFPLEAVDRIAANRYVLEAAARFPERIVPFMLVGDDTERWLAQGARGFKQQDILYAPERFDLHRAYAIMAEARVPMLIHFRHLPGTTLGRQVRAILDRTPTLKIIVAHLGRKAPNTAEGVSATLAELAALPSVTVETSTVRDPRAIEEAVRVLGENRVLFGSDVPFNGHAEPDPWASEFAVVQAAALAEHVRRKVLFDNARHVLEV